MFATGVTDGLAELIIDDSCLIDIAPERIPKDQLDLPDQLTGKARSGSTYLQYHDAISRRCSTSSQNFSMTDLEEQSRRELEHLNAMKDVVSKKEK